MNNTGGDMACPRCGCQMKIEGIYRICTNPVCTYRYEVPVKLPTYAQLLAENKQLKERIAKLEKQDRQ